MLIGFLVPLLFLYKSTPCNLSSFLTMQHNPFYVYLEPASEILNMDQTVFLITLPVSDLNSLLFAEVPINRCREKLIMLHLRILIIPSGVIYRPRHSHDVIWIGFRWQLAAR